MIKNKNIIIFYVIFSLWTTCMETVSMDDMQGDSLHGQHAGRQLVSMDDMQGDS